MKWFFRFLPSAFSKPARFVRVEILALALVASSVAADTRKKQQPSTTSSQQNASLRLWTGNFASKRTLRISLRSSGRKAVVSELAEHLESYHFADYAPVPTGTVTLEVFDSKDDKSPLATVSGFLAADSFWTVLLRETDGNVRAELIDDMPTDAGTVALTVRNLVPSLSTLQIDAGPDLHARLASPDSFIQIRGLAPGRIQVETSGSETSGKPVQWTNLIDFDKIHRATVLIFPDPYGRIRPRVVVDGQAAPAPSEEPKDSSPSPK